MFGLKLFRRNQPPATRHASPPAAPVARGWAAPAPRAAGPPPPPPPPEAFLSAQAPAIPLSAIPTPSAASSFEPSSFKPAAFRQPLSAGTPEQSPFEPPPLEQAPSANPDNAGTPDVDAPAHARVRFFYADGTVSEPDPQEAERLGYLATNLLEASRDDPQ